MTELHLLVPPTICICKKKATAHDAKNPHGQLWNYGPVTMPTLSVMTLIHWTGQHGLPNHERLHGLGGFHSIPTCYPHTNLTTVWMELVQSILSSCCCSPGNILSPWLHQQKEWNMMLVLDCKLFNLQFLQTTVLQQENMELQEVVCGNC